MKRNVMLFLDLRRAEQEYPISRRKIQGLIKDGRLRAFRLDGKIILRRQDIEQLLTAKPVGADLVDQKEDSGDVTQRNNFLMFIQMAQSGQLNDLVKRITGEDMPEPKEMRELPPAGAPFKARE